MQGAFQASINADPDCRLDSMKTMMIGIFVSFHNFQNAIIKKIMEQGENHATMMEQQKKDMEFQLEQRQDMALYMDIAVFTERSINSVINQIPQLMQGDF